MKSDETTKAEKNQFSHYYKMCPYEFVDVYRVLSLFEVTDPCIQHAIKKLLVAGGRGAKDSNKDVTEAIASLNRWIEMRKEENSENDDKKVQFSSK